MPIIFKMCPKILEILQIFGYAPNFQNVTKDFQNFTKKIKKIGSYDRFQIVPKFFDKNLKYLGLTPQFSKWPQNLRNFKIWGFASNYYNAKKLKTFQTLGLMSQNFLKCAQKC